jgi:serine/threonine-protein kinase
MATVYLARDVRHDRPVAVKVMRSDVSASLGTERFLREVRVAARLNHPHVLALHDSGHVPVSYAMVGGDEMAAGALLYYVMPYVQGESLRDRLQREGPLPIPDAVRIASEVAGALSFAHGQGVIHRDIKPENILLAGDRSDPNGSWHAVVADFGIARLLAETGPGMTETGVSLGTPAYMSPEQASGERTADARADLYSLGCLLYEMLVGEPPFTGPNASAIIARHLTAPVPSIRAVRPSVSPDLEALVHRALEKVPADRIATASAFKAAVDRIRPESRAGDHPSSAPSSLSRAFLPAAWRPAWLRWSIAAAAAATITLGIIAMARSWRARDPDLPAGRSFGAPVLDRTRIAVVPLRIVGDTSVAYLADASTDDLISALARVGSLRVMARSAVRAPDSTTRSTVDLARSVGAGSFIEGTFHQRGDSVRFDVALIDANTGEQVWSARYARRSSELAGVQDSVASAVARRIAAVDPPRSGAAATASPRPVSAAAYDAYLRGLYTARQIEQRSESRAVEDSAVRYFERALDLDSAFALAHAAIAAIYNARFFNYDPNPAWEERAFVEIEKALALDPNLAEAYQQKGNLTWTRANGFPHEAAAKLHRKATALKPSLVEPHNSLGAIYMHVGLFDRALAEYDSARTLDPTTTFVSLRIARIHWYEGKYAQALREFDAIPRRGSSLLAERALTLNYLGRRTEALAALDSAVLLAPNTQYGDIGAARAVVLASGGDRNGAHDAIDHALRGASKASHFHHAEYSIAQAYALLDERDKALEFLRRTAADGMPCYPLFERDPNLKSLAGDPRFVRFLAEMRARWEDLAKRLP